MPHKEFNVDQFRTDSLVYRSENNISRKIFSDKLKVNTETIFNYETGRAIPKAELIYNFCLIAGKDIHSYFK
jgi:DNA-binding XRE family transcriptional regulator